MSMIHAWFRWFMLGVGMTAVVVVVACVEPRQDPKPMELAQIQPPVVIPQPQHMQVLDRHLTLVEAGAIRVALREHGSLSRSGKRGLESIRARISELTGGRADIVPATNADMPVVIEVGLMEDFADRLALATPRKPEAYVIHCVEKAKQTEVLVAGHDQAGLFYGLLTLAQLLVKADDRVVLPVVEITDWPDLAWRVIPVTAMDEVYATYISEVGRVNSCFIPATEASFEEESPASMRRIVALGHDHGMKMVGDLGAFRQTIPRPKQREFCPLEDLPDALAVYQRMIAAGVDGLSWTFDDLTLSEMNHHRTCSRCSQRFKTLASWQVHCLEAMRQLGKEYGLRIYWACPSPYTLRHPSASDPLYYESKIPGFSIEEYFQELCHFPGSEDVRFWYCEFRPEKLALVRAWGLRNFMWWNNGPWSGVHREVWGAYVAFPRLGYSWDLYDHRLLGSEQRESFDMPAYQQLAQLKDLTDTVFSGTSDPVAVGIGTIHGWNNTALIKDEESVRRYLIEQLYGPGSHERSRQWESLVKPLWVKYLQLEPLSESDRSDLLRAGQLAEGFSQVLNQPQYACIRFQQVNQGFAEVMRKLTDGADLFKPLSNGASYDSPVVLRRDDESLLILEPTAIAPVDAITPLDFTATNRRPPVQVVTGQRVGVLMGQCQITTGKDPAFTLSRSAFSVETAITPAYLTYCLLIGTRHTYRDIYPGYPGWGVGLEPHSQALRLTLETPAGDISTVRMKARLPVATPTHIVAVRDWDRRRLLIYVNGELDESVDETGDGDLGERDTLQLSYDNMGGAHFQGAVHRLVLHPQALSAQAVQSAYQRWLTQTIKR